MAVTNNELSLFATSYTFYDRKNGRVFLIERVQDVVGNGQVFRKWKLYERNGFSWDSFTMRFTSYVSQAYKSQFNNLANALAALTGYCEREGITLTP